MREKILRLARFNQKWMGAVLLSLIYILGLGPAVLTYRLGRLLRISRTPPVAGWQPSPQSTLKLSDLEEQS